MEDITNQFDVIVVGAGPGGSIAAKISAEHGFSTCLLEKDTIGKTGRYKACGGALDWKLIERLNYPDEKIARVIKSLELHHVDGETYSKKGNGAVVWRNIFDKFLSDTAVESGANLKENEPLITIRKTNDSYTIITKKEEYNARFVIAADGVSSPTLKKLNWSYFGREDIVLTITQEMKCPKEKIDKILGPEAIHLFFGIKKLIPLGYAWLFPKAIMITVGWGNQLTLVKKARKEFNKFLELPLVTKVLKSSEIERFKAHLIPVGLRPTLYKDNVFAVGDAGGFVDPISGKGIPYSIKSGKIAVETIIECENKNQLEKLGAIYERKLDQEFLEMLKAKRWARDKIFRNDETLKKFLSLWEKYRSSEIIMRNLI